MTARHRRDAAVICLLLLGTAASAEQPPQPPIAPLQQATPPYQPGSPTVNKTPSLVQPPPAQPVLPPPVPSAAVATASAPVTFPLPKPIPEPASGGAPQDPAWRNEQHSREKSTADESVFELRQAVEMREFKATLVGKGFWERRRLTRQFRSAQIQRRKEFDAEQEKKKRASE